MHLQLDQELRPVPATLSQVADIVVVDLVVSVQRGLVDLEERPGGHGPGLGAHVERASFARVGAIAIGGRVIREERRDAAYERGALMQAFSYTAGSVLLSIGALFVGLWVARNLA